MNKGEENNNNKSWQDHGQWDSRTERALAGKRDISYIYIIYIMYEYICILVRQS